MCAQQSVHAVQLRLPVHADLQGMLPPLGDSLHLPVPALPRCLGSARQWTPVSSNATNHCNLCLFQAVSQQLQ